MILRDAVWIAWERHRRSMELADALEVPLEIMDYHGSRLARWLVLSCRTLQLLAKLRPRTLIVQNPSLVLSLLAVCAKPVFRYHLIVDAHTAGVFPLNARYAFLNLLSKFIQSRADITIVTTETLACIVHNHGGRPAVLLDRIPAFPKPRTTRLAGSFNVAYVCTYSHDEPFMEVLEAGKFLPNDVFIYVTGDKKKLHGKVLPPRNIVLTGFLSEDQYLALLYSADAVLVLTTREHCVLCGAYEAFAFSKPLILSQTMALRQAFGDGALYATNDPKNIADAILQMRADTEHLSSALETTKTRLEQDWQRSLQQLRISIRRLEDVSQ